MGRIRDGKGKAAYKRKRLQLARQVKADNLPCHICGNPIDLTLDHQHPMSYTADHLDALANGGSMTGALAPAH